jgi:ADP-ribose pyrophosphatase YjhB (NUDIX family)
VGVSLVVLDEQERILLLRHVFHARVPWGLPGGWLGRNESPAAGALRELKEETGLTAVLGPIILAGQEPGPPHLGLAYMATASSATEITLSPEILEAAWFPLDQLPPIYPFSYQAIQTALHMHQITPNLFSSDDQRSYIPHPSSFNMEQPYS